MRNKQMVKEIDYYNIEENTPHYSVGNTPPNGSENNLTGIINIVRNNNSKKKLEKQKDSFIASLGHDLKNPITAQIRALELILKGNFGILNTEQQEILDIVLDSCKYMNAMLTTLLHTYRNNEGAVKLNYEKLDLVMLSRNAIESAQYIAQEKGIALNFISNEPSCIFEGDFVQIRRVITNLISNAIKYAYSHTQINIYVTKTKEYVEFRFENESPYIPPERQTAIFEQYITYAKENNTQGTGLGLYASKKIIEAHGGELYVKSYEEGRSIFGFIILTRPKHRQKQVVF